MKKFVWIIILFLLVSLLAMFPPREHRNDGYYSAELETKKIELGNLRISATVNEDDSIIMPANSKYAIMVEDLNEAGKVVLERYYSEGKYRTFAELEASGEAFSVEYLTPAAQWDNQYALSREYNDRNECISYTYLDWNGKAMNGKNGYATVQQEYDEYHRKVGETYFDIDGKRVKNGSGVWKITFQYPAVEEDGQISWLAEYLFYWDENDEPMRNNSGRAGVRRIYNEQKRTEMELVLDEEGRPAKDKMGSYGARYSYDDWGRQVVTTYIDAEGNPMVCKDGYASVERTYFKTGAPETEMYFDENGSPAVLSRGESGIYHGVVSSKYLNAEGKRLLLLDNYLYGSPILVIGAALVIWLISSCLGKRGNLILLVLYVAFILYMTLWTRESGDTVSHIGLINAVKLFVAEYSGRVEVIDNIYLFIPFGVLLYHLIPKRRMVLAGIALSVAIETIQYVFHLGTAELSDVIANGTGTAIGCMMGVFNWAGHTFGKKDSAD